MDDKKEFRGLKIGSDFFEDDRIDYMLSQPNGTSFLVIWEQLMLKAIDNDYTIESEPHELLDYLKYYSYMTIGNALAVFQKLKIIVIEDETIYFLASDGKTKLRDISVAYADKKRQG